MLTQLFIVYFFPFYRNWPLSEIMKICILRMEEAGLVRKWKNDYNRTNSMLVRTGNNPDSIPQVSDDNEALKKFTVKDVAGHLELLCAGLFVSALTFCAELWRGHGAGERLRRRSRRVRAQLRRTGARLRRVGAQMRKCEWSETVRRTQLLHAIARCLNRN